MTRKHALLFFTLALGLAHISKAVTIFNTAAKGGLKVVFTNKQGADRKTIFIDLLEDWKDSGIYVPTPRSEPIYLRWMFVKSKEDNRGYQHQNETIKFPANTSEIRIGDKTYTWWKAERLGRQNY